MPRYTNSFVEVSSLGNFETEIERLYRRIRNRSTDSSTAQVLSSQIDQTPVEVAYANITIDNGNSRTKAGLKSLELLSIIRSGTAPQNLFLFDNVIYFGSPSDFDTGDTEKLADIVIVNLGMQLVVDSLADNTVQQFREVCGKIGMLVKTGKYTSDRYSSFITKESRRLVKLYIEATK